MNEEPPRKKITIDLDFFGPPPERTLGTVRLLPSDIQVALEAGESIFEGARRAGIQIPSICGGKGTCGCCRVRFEHPAHEPSIIEHKFIDRSDLSLGIRLACRARPTRPVTVTVLPEERRHR
jgi:ferredoxin